MLLEWLRIQLDIFVRNDISSLFKTLITSTFSYLICTANLMISLLRVKEDMFKPIFAYRVVLFYLVSSNVQSKDPSANRSIAIATASSFLQ